MKFPNNNSIKKLIIDFYLLLLITAIFLFFAPKIVTILFFLITLIKYFRSKDDFFWLAYAIIITDGVGGIFYGQAKELLSLGHFNITYLTLFSIVSFIKYLKSPHVQLFFMRKYYIIYSFLIIILLLYGISAHGILGGGGSGYRYVVLFIQAALYLPFAITIPKSLNSYENVVNFSVLLISLVPLNIIGQLYFLYSGVSISTRFGISDALENAKNVLETDKVLRPAFGSTPLFFGFIMALFFYFSTLQEKKMFKKSILLLFIFLNILSVFITATRGWIIAYIIILGLISIQNSFQRKNSKFVITIGILIGISIAIFSVSKVLRSHLGKTINRLSTVELILEGDKTAGETNERLTTRNDKIMKVYKDNSKIFGTGISNTGLDSFDQHTGNQSMLATGGLLEFLTFISLIFYIILKTVSINKSLNSKNIFKKRILFFIYFLIGILFLHSTSSYKFSIVGWFKYSGAFTFVITFFTLYNRSLFEAINEDSKILKLNEQ